VIGIDAAVATDPVIAANTFIYLNTDQNKATGRLPPPRNRSSGAVLPKQTHIVHGVLSFSA
jgi:hypothetical protein